MLQKKKKKNAFVSFKNPKERVKRVLKGLVQPIKLIFCQFF